MKEFGKHVGIESDIEMKRRTALNTLETLAMSLKDTKRHEQYNFVIDALKKYVALATSREEAGEYLKYAFLIIDEQRHLPHSIERSRGDLKTEVGSFIDNTFEN
ncbi:MAG: hypothetical protein ABII02_00165 [Candidatus Magasanikbacteria bacterium]